jgi:carbon-monoxide dehydrogenase small subunit/glyceraldehyde dehydrogenase small subunit
VSERLPISATVNGRPVTDEVEPRVTLAEYLRDHLGMTGTKLSCELQVCGVCTVLVDGDPVSACTYLAADLDGREVTTIEGIGTEGDLHPLQQAFIDEFAIQCGYCTPGFIMMSLALLNTNPQPTRADVTHYLEGNICRCTGYRPIIDAILSVASASAQDER